MPKRQPRSFSREFKLKAIERLEAGESGTALSRELSVKRAILLRRIEPGQALLEQQIAAAYARVVAAFEEVGVWRGESEGWRPAPTERIHPDPWVDEVLVNALGRNGARNVRLVQGSHIVIRRRIEHGRAYFFQNADGRIIFAIPYEGDFTLIGTTDLDYSGAPQAAGISEVEIAYLMEAANEYFLEPVQRDEIVWSFSGVRPLFDDGATKAQEATRDYVLKDEMLEGVAPLINIFGGKLTTYRRLSEAVLERIEKHLGPKGGPWTAAAKRFRRSGAVSRRSSVIGPR